MKNLFMIAIATLSTVAFAQDKQAPILWADQVQCDFQVSYQDMTSADVATKQLDKSMLFDLEVKDSGYGFKQVTFDFPEVETKINVMALFENRDYNKNPAEIKRLNITVNPIIENSNYGQTISVAAAAKSKDLVTSASYSFDSADSMALYKFAEEVGKPNGMSGIDMIRKVFAGRTKVVRTISAICSASQMKKTPITPGF